MGTYVHYSLGQKDGIESIVFENLHNLIKCMDNCRIKYPEDYNESIYRMACHMNKHGPSSLSVDSSEEAALIDRVVDELIMYEELSSVTGVEYSLFEKIDTSMMKLFRYADSLKTVLPDSSNHAQRIYNTLLFDGMSIAKCSGHKYESDDGVYKISWVLPSEIEDLIKDLAPITRIKEWENEQESGVFYLYDALCKAGRKGSALVVEIA
ncbi:hypothetical protein [Pleionea sediminis]|uniref:hypothetical protein n=1 Tax=Pleionea sediminis TaxID=2569479 RepID=UPI001185CCCB|nr:hypothetical protein [Pleionea sediminis]